MSHQTLNTFIWLFKVKPDSVIQVHCIRPSPKNVGPIWTSRADMEGWYKQPMWLYSSLIQEDSATSRGFTAFCETHQNWFISSYSLVKIQKFFLSYCVCGTFVHQFGTVVMSNVMSWLLKHTVGHNYCMSGMGQSYFKCYFRCYFKY